MEKKYLISDLENAAFKMMSFLQGLKAATRNFKSLDALKLGAPDEHFSELVLDFDDALKRACLHVNADGAPKKTRVKRAAKVNKVPEELKLPPASEVMKGVPTPAAAKKGKKPKASAAASAPVASAEPAASIEQQELPVSVSPSDSDIEPVSNPFAPRAA